MIPKGNYFKSRNEYTLYLSGQSRWVFFLQMTLTFVNTCNYVNIFFKTRVHIQMKIKTTDQTITDKESATSALKRRGLRQLATEVDDLAQSLVKDKKLKQEAHRP